MKNPSNVLHYLVVISQVRPGPVTWTHTAPGEDVVPKQAHEVEEDGKRQHRSKAWQVWEP